jgi:hypothetical protein
MLESQLASAPVANSGSGPVRIPVEIEIFKNSVWPIELEEDSRIDVTQATSLDNYMYIDNVNTSNTSIMIVNPKLFSMTNYAEDSE